jgi:hypothetical protein
MLTTKNAPDPPRLSVLALAPVALRAPSAKARTETTPPLDKPLIEQSKSGPPAERGQRAD